MLDHAYTPETWLPYLLILVDFLKALAWPIAVGFVAFTYREGISKLIQRINSVSVGGAKADFVLKQDSNEKAEIDRSIQKQSINPLRSPAMDRLERKLSSDIEGLPDDEARRILLSAFTKERMEKVFSLAYANILAAQIDALKALIKEGGHIGWEAANSEFTALQENEPLFKQWNLDKFLSYLKSYEFISTNEHGIDITDYGTDFLNFLNTNRLSR
jgi:hypothetical protein